MLFHQNLSKIDEVEAEILQKTWEVRETKYGQGSSFEVTLVQLKKSSPYDATTIIAMQLWPSGDLSEG